MLKSRANAGFTLIELMISLVILAILLSLGMPAFTGILESSRTKAAASGFTTVWFIPEPGFAGWVLNTANSLTTPAPFEAKPSNESSGDRVTVVIDPATVTRVNFNSLGRATGRADDGTLVNAGAPVSFNFSGPSGCGAEIRCLRVQVSEGGQIRVCDPAVANTADTRSCGT